MNNEHAVRYIGIFLTLFFSWIIGLFCALDSNDYGDLHGIFVILIFLAPFLLMIIFG